jgi:DNA-binding transcriptional ArsR family regulator
MTEEQVIEGLGALAHPVRLRVFRALVVAGQAGLTPATLQASLGIPATTLSFHLKDLSRSGLATVERSSRHLIYRAAYDRMNGLIAYLTAHCCSGVDCGVPPPTAVCAC